MEITKIWTLSTGHITEETNEYLSESVDSTDLDRPVVYAKGEYGYYIPVVYFGDHIKLPKDLQKILDIADDLDCTLVCLDRDGEVLSWLPVYDW